MSQPIVYVDRSLIRPGRVEQLRAAIAELAAFIRAEEPQLLFYGFHFDQDETLMTVVAVHPDPASLELHLRVGDAAFRGFADLLELQQIEVFGEPGPEVLERLRDKARMLGDRSAVQVHRLQGGFQRLTGLGTGTGDGSAP